MSDCALAIANAVNSVYKGYSGAPLHYWCVFHVLKAFCGKAKTYLGDQWTKAFTKFRTIMYSQVDPASAFDSFMVWWGRVSPGFFGYVQGQWANRMHNWALFYQTVSNFLYSHNHRQKLITSLLSCFTHQTNHQGVYTNNYTESWQRLLKSSYLPPPERLRIEEVVQILTDDVESHYQWAQMQVENGFAEQTTNKFQQRAKLLSESFTKDDLELLGIACSKDATGVRSLNLDHNTWLILTQSTCALSSLFPPSLIQ
jgi:hypothetical protein